MQDSRILTAIDVGTTKVFTIVGRKDGSGGVKVLAYSVVPCEGLRKGNVADVAATSKAIMDTLREVEQLAGVKVESAYVGVTGSHVTFENRRDSLQWVGNRGVITEEDLKLVPERVASAANAAGRKVLHALPITYTLDGKNGIRNPLGMHTGNLEVETHVVTAAMPFVERLMDAVEGAGIAVDALVLEPIASSEAVLTQEERERGAALVDIGGGTTDIVIFKRGAVNYTTVLPIGGFQFTNDIAVTYNTPLEDAEEIKLKYAHTEPDTVRPDEEVALRVYGRTSRLSVPLRDICMLTRERTQELMRMIKLKLREAGIFDIESVQLVFTGGASNLPGLVPFIKKTATGKVRIGVPSGSASGVQLPDALRAPSFATGAGILLWAARQERAAAVQAASRASEGGAKASNRKGVMSRFFKQMKSLWPVG